MLLDYVSEERARNFQELLRARRGKRSQQEVAKEAGVSQALISSLERGPQIGMRVFDLFKVISYYHIEPNEIAEVLGFPIEHRSLLEMGDRELERLFRRAAGLSGSDLKTLEQVLDLVLRGLGV